MEKYRTFFPRLVALLIDSFIMLPLAIFDDWFRQAEFPPLFFYFWIPLFAFATPVYRILMHARFGQTLGKMYMNVKVQSADETPVKFSQAFIRETPQLLVNAVLMFLSIKFLAENPESESVTAAFKTFNTIAGIWGLADILTFFANEKRRALHDFLAGTQVVKMKDA